MSVPTSDPVRKELKNVADLLQSLQASVAALQSSTVPALSSEALPSHDFQDKAGPPQLRRQDSGVIRAVLARGISLETDNSDGDTTATRPTLYPRSHAPAPRLDALEHADWDKTDVLDALRLDKFEGLYNLSFLVLVFSLAYSMARSVRETGVLLDAHDFTCSQIFIDGFRCICAAAVAYVFSFVCFALTRLWARGVLPFAAYAWLYVMAQATLLAGVVVFCFTFDLAPLPSMALLLVTAVLTLKMHSYVATNYAMSVEHVARYGTMSQRSTATAPAAGVAMSDHMSVTSSRAPALPALGMTPPTTTSTAGAVVGLPGPTGSTSNLRRRRRVASSASSKALLLQVSQLPSDTTELESPRLSLSRAASSGNVPLLSSSAVPSDEDSSPITTAAVAEGGGDLIVSATAAAAPAVLVSVQKMQLQSRIRRDSSAGVAANAPAVPVEPPSPQQQSAASESARVGSSTRGIDIISGTREQKRVLIKAWPHNQSLVDYCYFLAAPTLVYEPRYPRTKSIRWSYVALKLSEMTACSLASYVLLKQFMLPVLQRPTTPSQAELASEYVNFYVGLAGG